MPGSCLIWISDFSVTVVWPPANALGWLTDGVVLMLIDRLPWAMAQAPNVTAWFMTMEPVRDLITTLADGTERRYSLRQISRDRKSYLFLRVDDPKRGLNYGVYELGRFVPLKVPELRVDQHGLAHVLHLAAPNQFLHSVFSPTGDLVAQQSHSGDSNVVRLRADEAAGYQVIVTGVSEPRDPFVESLPSRNRL